MDSAERIAAKRHSAAWIGCTFSSCSWHSTRASTTVGIASGHNRAVSKSEPLICCICLAGPAQHYNHLPGRTRRKSRRIHLVQERLRNHSELLGSVAHSSAGPAQHYCHLHRESERVPPGHDTSVAKNGGRSCASGLDLLHSL